MVLRRLQDEAGIHIIQQGGLLLAMWKGSEVGVNIREISRDEYLAGLQGEIRSVGLIEAVKKRLDEINHEALSLSYAECGLIQEMSVEIIDLLKEQEPRVMTLEEAFDAEVCWFEDRSPYGTIVDACTVYDFGETLKVQCFGDLVYPRSKADHNKIFRFWSSRPTDEQRQAVKWND